VGEKFPFGSTFVEDCIEAGLVNTNTVENYPDNVV